MIGLVATLALSAQAVHTMDDLAVQNPKEKARAESAEGKFGKATRFRFDDDCRSVFCMTRIRGTPEWDKADGLSFWVKGDGSKRFGGIQFIWNDDFAARYDVLFPIDGTDWKKITVAWRDLVPALPGAKFLDPQGGPAPSKFSALWFGKWWYWRDYGAHSYAIDEMRLEPAIDLDRNLYAPPGPPLERVLAKLKAGRPVTIVTMGDSLTDTKHWANRQVNWPALLVKSLRERFGSEVTVVNPAIGGTQLRQNLVLMPRWLAEAPEPDLVTVCFGFNDWEAGMRGEAFRETVREAADRIRRATRGKAEVLFLTTCPALEKWTTMAELGEAVRAAASERKAAVADIEKAFHAVPAEGREKLFCGDKVHLGPFGHETVAATVLRALESAGR